MAQATFRVIVAETPTAIDADPVSRRRRDVFTPKLNVHSHMVIRSMQDYRFHPSKNDVDVHGMVEFIGHNSLWRSLLRGEASYRPKLVDARRTHYKTTRLLDAVR